ncbi:MAG TPA: HEAT repeat domain-containing protein, partial [Steroidobacteraceae bacterium]|nr:HEAT repeat domain-containing protein [Steroidobacteraceae bacterium]
ENASAASGQAVAQPTPAPATFRVRVQLQNEATDTVAAAIIDSFHSALLEQLRTVPGLDLVTQDVTAAEPDDPATYQFLVLGSGPSQDNKFSATLMLDARKAARGGYVARYMFQLIGDIGIACYGWGSVDPPSCRDPVAAAADVVGGLRITQFPADPSLREQQQARLLDSSLDPVQRLKALADLASPSSPGRGSSGAESVHDARVVRGAIELAAATADPTHRAQIWRAVRGVNNAALVEPLLVAVRTDPDGSVRMQAVETLAAGFASDSHVHAALELVAANDTRPIVRALARRALAGDATWNEYVTTSLKDAGRPAAERIEAFLYHAFAPARTPGSYLPSAPQAIRELLDTGAIRALTEVFPQVREFPGGAGAKKWLLSALPDMADGPVETDLMVDMIVENLERGVDRIDWLVAVEGLIRRNGIDPRVHAALEELAADDPDLDMRAAAMRLLALEAYPAPAAVTPPPRTP